VAADRVHHGSLERGGKGSALLSALKSQLGGERQCSQAFSLRGGGEARSAHFDLDLGGHGQQIRGAEGISSADGIESQPAEELRGEHVTARCGDVALFEHVPFPAPSGAPQQFRAGKFPNVVVDPLAGKTEAASQPGSGIRLGQGFEDLAAKGMEQGGGAGETVEEREVRLFLHCDQVLTSDTFSCHDKYICL
jgi:hypothetical protein